MRNTHRSRTGQLVDWYPHTCLMMRAKQHLGLQSTSCPHHTQHTHPSHTCRRLVAIMALPAVALKGAVFSHSPSSRMGAYRCGLGPLVSDTGGDADTAPDDPTCGCSSCGGGGPEIMAGPRRVPLAAAAACVRLPDSLPTSSTPKHSSQVRREEGMALRLVMTRYLGARNNRGKWTGGATRRYSAGRRGHDGRAWRLSGSGYDTTLQTEGRAVEFTHHFSTPNA